MLWFFKKNKINIDHIDLLSIKPLDIQLIINSIRKTGKLLILDNSSHAFCSISSEIIAQITSRNIDLFKKEPLVYLYPIYPIQHLIFTKKYYNLEKKFLKISLI